VKVDKRPGVIGAKHVKKIIAIAAPVILPLAANALDLTGLPTALAEKVTAARQPVRVTRTGSSPSNGER
jgi:hypothetical protein